MSDKYSFSLTTFSPSGKLGQIENAFVAVSKGSTSIGIKVNDGIVIATEKKLPSLVEPSTVQRIVKVTEHIGMVYSGMGPDFRVLVRKSRKKAQTYFRFYKESIPVLQLVKEIAYIMQEYTQTGGVRPFGVSLLVVGWDEKGHQLFQVDPSGAYFEWKATALGKGMAQAKTFLEKRYRQENSLHDAIQDALNALKEGFDGQVNGNNVEVAIVTNETGKFTILSPDDILDYLDAQ